MGNGRRHGGGANALSAAAVPERAALMLPVFAGCHSLDLRSTPRPDSAEPVGAFHDSANLNLAKRRLCAALGISLGSSEHCCAISVARVRAALTASIPRSNRPLARRTNFGAAKSCSLVIIFMIRPPTAVPANQITPVDRGLMMTHATVSDVMFSLLAGCKRSPSPMAPVPTKKPEAVAFTWYLVLGLAAPAHIRTRLMALAPAVCRSRQMQPRLRSYIQLPRASCRRW
jgi:hypothetical protein